MKRAYRYLLGDSRREAARLRRQARLWDPVAGALFDRLGVKRGWKILEIGPGAGSLHLELRRRARGPVDAVERSPVFAENLRRLCARDGFGADRIWNEDLIGADLPAGTYDLIFARWVFLFLPDTEAHVRKLVRALKPGGVLAVEDYHRETLSQLPRPAGWDDFMAADRKFFASQGGNWSVAGSLPGIYRPAGLELIEIVPTIKTGRPGTDVWDWLSAYFLDILDRYAAFPPFSGKKAAALRKAWLAAARNAQSLMIAPAVVDVVGRKPRGKR